MPSEEHVYFIPVDDTRLIAVSDDVTGGEDVGPDYLDISNLIDAVGPLIAAVLRAGGVGSARLYEMSPASQKLLASARKDEVGMYFRGVLRAEDGRITHQVQLREVSPASAPLGLDTVLVAQMAAVQAQLGRIEAIVNDVAISTERVVAFVERQQRSWLVEALRLISDVHERATRSAKLTGTDWERISGIELNLNAQLRAISDELNDRLRDARFTGNPGDDARVIAKLDAARVDELMQLHRVLIGGLGRLQELVLLRKLAADDFDEAELEAMRARIGELYDTQDRLHTEIQRIVRAAERAQPRSPWKRLVTDGLVVGRRNDERNLNKIVSGRARLAGSIEHAAVSAAALQSVDAPEIDSGPAEDSGFE